MSSNADTTEPYTMPAITDITIPGGKDRCLGANVMEKNNSLSIIMATAVEYHHKGGSTICCLPEEDAMNHVATVIERLEEIPAARWSEKSNNFYKELTDARVKWYEDLPQTEPLRSHIASGQELEDNREPTMHKTSMFLPKKFDKVTVNLGHYGHHSLTYDRDDSFQSGTDDAPMYKYTTSGPVRIKNKHPVAFYGYRDGIDQATGSWQLSFSAAGTGPEGNSHQRQASNARLDTLAKGISGILSRLSDETVRRLRQGIDTRMSDAFDEELKEVHDKVMREACCSFEDTCDIHQSEEMINVPEARLNRPMEESECGEQSSKILEGTLASLDGQTKAIANDIGTFILNKSLPDMVGTNQVKACTMTDMMEDVHHAALYLNEIATQHFQAHDLSKDEGTVQVKPSIQQYYEQPWETRLKLENGETIPTAEEETRAPVGVCLTVDMELESKNGPEELKRRESFKEHYPF